MNEIPVVPYREHLVLYSFPEFQERHFTASRTMEGRLARCIKNGNHKPDDDEVTTTESLEKVDLKCQMFVIGSD